MTGKIVGVCGNEQVHSRKGSCDVIPDKTRSLFIASKDAPFPLDDEAFKAAFAGYVSADNNLRIIPIGPVSGNEPKGGDLATSELGNYGGSVTVGVNPMSISYQVENASACQYKELAKLNKRTVRVFHGDAAGFVFGTVRKVGDKYVRAGFLGTAYVREVEPTGTTPYQVFVNIDYSSSYEAEKKARIGTHIGNENYPEGLSGITLVPGAAGTATIETSCSGMDITADYGPDWDTSMFIAEDGSNPTTVTYADGKLTIAPAGKYKIAPASVLESGDILGLEGVGEYATITAS